MHRYKAFISCAQRNGYHLAWKSKKDFNKFMPKVEEFNFYNDSQEGDTLVPIIESNLKFSINQQPSIVIKRKKIDTFVVSFTGEITFELDKKDYKMLEKKAYSIDYLMEFVDHDDELAESDEDYELIKNQNIVLKDIEEIRPAKKQIRKNEKNRGLKAGRK